MANIVGGVTSINNPRTNWAQNDKTKADYLKNKPSVANAVKGTAVGSVLTLDDVSPIEHEMGVKVRSKNRITNSYSLSAGAKLEQDGNSFILTRVSGAVYFVFNLGDYQPFAGKTFTFSFFLDAMEPSTNNKCRVTFYYGLRSDSTKITIFSEDILRADVGKKIEYTVTMPEMDEYIKPLTLTFYPFNAANGDTMTISNLQLEGGTEATEFTPYVEDVSGVKVMSGTETYAPNADGTVEGIVSTHPVTTLATDTDGTVIECTYYRDTNSVITELETKLNTLVATIVG